jgi:tRNA nucleotidyltransferase (CCA-adding enzyme)
VAGPPSPPFDADPAALAVLERLWRAGHAAYLVGGAVRDALLGRPSHDWDVATDARPEGILRLFPGSSYENRFGTVLVGGVEVTTFRRDHRYADHRRPDTVTFGTDLLEDLARRDFTVNAIAWGRAADAGPGDPGQIVDPHAGRADLVAGLLRAVGDPDARFEEDALRLVRAARIAAAVDLDIDAATEAGMARRAADVTWVSAERLGIEVRRMLAAPQPSRAFRILERTGVLQHVLPELSALRGAGADLIGGEDLLGHSLSTLDAAAVAPRHEPVLLAALLHAVGGSHAVEGDARREAARIAAAIVERLRLPLREAAEVARLVAHHVPGPEAGESDAALRRFIRSVGPALVDDLLRLRRAEDIASGRDPGTSGTDELARRVGSQLAAKVPLSLADLAVDGHDLQEELGLARGPALGAVLGLLLEVVLDDPARNTREDLLALAGAEARSDGSPTGSAVGSQE